MPSNQKLILDTLLGQRKAEYNDRLSDADYFEVFASEQILKDYELSLEEVEEGITGNGNDGGIDAIYVFANSDLIRLDADLLAQKRNIQLEVVLIQSKVSSSFSESALQKFVQSAGDLFNLEKHRNELSLAYNAELLDIRDNFKKQYLNLASKFPRLTFSYYYVTKGDDVYPNVGCVI